MPNIFLPSVSKSMTYTSLLADPGRLAGFGKSKQRLKAQIALTPAYLLCLSEPHTSVALGAPCGSVCFSGLLAGLFVSIFVWAWKKRSGDYLYPFGCGRARLSRDLQASHYRAMSSQTQEGVRKHHMTGRHGPPQTPPTKGGPRCRAWGRDQEKEMENSSVNASWSNLSTKH